MSSSSRGSTVDRPHLGLAELPASLGKYALRKELGRGGMGVVYEGVDTVLERPVALKVVSGQGVDGHSLARLLREARLAARLQHPNTVAVFDAGDHPSGLFIAMELVRGASAHEALQNRGRLNWQAATRIVLEVARGLAAAHAAGLIHRDIKPANILLADNANDHQPQAKLADFGLSRTIDRSAPTVEGQLAGTPHYMSPEQIRGETLDERTDIYSLGATYYSLLTGRFPFERDSVIQMLFAHCSAAPPDPRELVPEIPAACAAIVLRAMAKEPRDRYASAEAMLRDLQAVIETRSVSEGAPAKSRSQGPPWERISRSSASLTAIYVLTCAALLIGGMALLKAPGPAVKSTASHANVQRPPAETPRPTLEPAGMTIESPWGEGLHGRLKLDGEIEFMRLARDGRTLAIGLSRGDQHHGRLLLYDWQSREVLFRYDEARQYASFSAAAFPNERFVVLACSSKVVAIDRETNEATKLLELSDGSATSVDVSSDGQRLVLGVVAWNGTGRIELYDLHLEGEHPQVEHLRRLPLEHHGGVRSVAFAPNDQWIASTDEGGGVCISHGTTGELKHAGELPERRGGKGEVGYVVTFSPDSQTVAAGGALGVVLFDVESGERRVLPEEHKHGVMSLAFAPDGTQLASGVPDGIRLWNVERGWQVGPTREAHECNVICGLAYAKDGKTLISAGFDRRIEFWSLKQ